MKNYTLILLLAAMMIACQHNRTRNSIETFTVEEEVFASDTIGLIVQSDNAVLEELTEISPHIAYVESEVERWIGEDDSTLKSTDEIDATLTAMFNKYYENDYESDYEKDEGRMYYPDILERVLSHYLNQPSTFTEKLPLLGDRINILKTPDGKYKFYNYWLYGGSSSWESNFVQYRDGNGMVTCMPYKNHLRYDRGIANVWQFVVKDKTYYAIKSFRQGATGIWHYYMEIVSDLSGTIIEHPEFFPAEAGEIITEDECFIYDESGRTIDYGKTKASYVVVCGTENMNLNVDYTFDPETLTVYVKEDAGTSSNRAGTVTNKQWRLKIQE